VIDLMGLDLPVPDHTTLSRRAQKQPTRIRSSLPDGPLHVLADSTGLKGRWCMNAAEIVNGRNWFLMLAITPAFLGSGQSSGVHMPACD
jgi:hypothetical protein